MKQPSSCLMILVAAVIGSLPLATAVLPGQALANDRDLLATPVPAAACVRYFADNTEGGALNSGAGGPWFNGVFALTGVDAAAGSGQASKDFRLHCPLPVNNVEVSNSTSSDNDITAIRVLYRDGDGRAVGTLVEVALYQTTLLATGAVQSRAICRWNSNTAGTGSTGYARATFACAHDLPPGALYHFDVRLFTTVVTDQIAVGFGGIDFP